jgi:hypothetical protein
VGVAAPAFAQAQDAPVSLSGLSSASGVLCGVSLPVSTLSGVTGSLQNGSLNGGAISTPLSGQNS